MRQEVYTKFAAALDGRVQQKRAEARRDAVYCKLAEALARGRMEKSARLGALNRVLPKILRGLRGAAGRFGGDIPGAVERGERLAPLTNSVGRSLKRLGLTAYEAASPKVNLNMSNWNPLKLLTSVRTSDPLRKVPERLPTPSPVPEAAPGGSSVAAVLSAGPKYEGTLKSTRRVSPGKVLGALSLGGGATYATLRNGSDDVQKKLVQPSIQDNLQSVLSGLGGEASALWKAVQANPRLAIAVAALLAGGGYGLHALASD